nr:HNH endonuclease [Rhabdothermincola salaria]
MLRPLIEVHWAADVAKWSGISLEDERLHGHLFGAERAAFPAPLRKGLVELQEGRCFYCGSPLRRSVQVDHFLAWSRWPNDAIENLVAADRCNTMKSSHLAATSHLDQWRTRFDRSGTDLVAVAAGAGWVSDPARSLALVRSTYGHVVAGTPLWVEDRVFEAADGPVAV